MSVKLEGFVKPYRGRQEESWDTFWEKFVVLADVSGWTDEAAMMKRVPLFLEGDAFLVFSKMESTDKKSKDKVAATMLKSFGASKSVAYRSFTSRRLREDESVDAFVADLRRLLTMSGHTDTGDKDAMVIEQMLAGVPIDIAQQTRLAFAGKEMTVTGCADAVRALVSVQSPSRSVAAVATSRHTGGSCYACGEPGHMKRDCPRTKSSFGKPKSFGKSGKSSERRPIVCFFCETEGHTRLECPERKAWLASKRVAAAASTPTETKAKCLATVASEGPLPHIFVDVSPDGDTWARARGVIDTGSTRTLISSEFASECNLVPLANSGSTMMTIDGQFMTVIGTVPVKLQRTDGAVSLPCISVDACVVDTLDVVQSEVLVGNDVVTGSGGVFLDYSESGVLCRVVFGTQQSLPPAPSDVTAASVVSSNDDVDHPSYHVSAERDSADIVLTTDDAEVRWNGSSKQWVASWKWKSGTPPIGTIGSGIGEYSRNKLTAEQEQLFTQEVDSWIERGWLVPHDEQLHGKPACVLPPLAQVQEHKESTPVRPCLDYRKLNECLISKPGVEVPVCEETLRRWRRAGDAD
eukprot:scpid93880/ scgid32998/ 